MPDTLNGIDNVRVRHTTIVRLRGLIPGKSKGGALKGNRGAD
jgi:hypothetical protein